MLVNAVVGAYMNEVVDADRRMRRERLSDLQKITTEKEDEIRTKREQLKREEEKKLRGYRSSGQEFDQLRNETGRGREILERILRNVAAERERLKVELATPPRVRVLGDRDAPRRMPRICPIDRHATGRKRVVSASKGRGFESPGNNDPSRRDDRK